MSSTDTEILRRYAPPPGIKYLQYSLALEKRYLPQMRKMISEDLSEPYSIYVYRYFLYQWGELCYLAVREQDQDESQADHPTDDDPEALSELGASPAPPNDLISVIICKLEPHRGGPLRGYIAMLATKASHRGQGIARALVRMALDAMIARDADEIALETEESNAAAMALYESLGFLRSKKPASVLFEWKQRVSTAAVLQGGGGAHSDGEVWASRAVGSGLEAAECRRGL